MLLATDRGGEGKEEESKNVLVGSVSFVNRVIEQDISSCPFLCLCIRNSDYLRPHFFRFEKEGRWLPQVERFVHCTVIRKKYPKRKKINILRDYTVRSHSTSRL